VCPHRAQWPKVACELYLDYLRSGSAQRQCVLALSYTDMPQLCWYATIVTFIAIYQTEISISVLDEASINYAILSYRGTACLLHSTHLIV
jgi:hypothetical protein